MQSRLSHTEEPSICSYYNTIVPIVNSQFAPIGEEQIQQFTHHNERRYLIRLFLRSTPGIEYTYLGLLKYLWHDPARERPIYFRWQILDWHIPPATLQRMGLAYSPSCSAGLRLRPA
jgi:hypothetical protein